MADDRSEDRADDPSNATEYPSEHPSPTRRPSATSRARRIGGLAGATVRTDSSPRPSSAAAMPEPPPAPTASPSAQTAPAADEPVAAADPADDAEVGSAEPQRTGGSAANDRTVARLTWTPAVVLIAAVIAMAVIVTVASHGVWWGQRYDAPSKVNPLRNQVSAAAKTCLARTNSYDYRNLDAFEKAGLACTTGQETSQFRQAVESIIRPNATKIRATQSAQINTTGIESVSGTQWTLLVYGQLKVTNSSTPKGRIDPFAAEVRMDKVGGKWLIAAEKVVSQPAS